MSGLTLRRDLENASREDKMSSTHLFASSKCQALQRSARGSREWGRWKCAGAEPFPGPRTLASTPRVSPAPSRGANQRARGRTSLPGRSEKIAAVFQPGLRQIPRWAPARLADLPRRGNGRRGGAGGCWAGRVERAAGGRRRLRKVSGALGLRRRRPESPPEEPLPEEPRELTSPAPWERSDEPPRDWFAPIKMPVYLVESGFPPFVVFDSPCNNSAPQFICRTQLIILALHGDWED